jgi:hypothetical protein
MARARPTISSTMPLPLPFVPAVDLSPFVRMTTDLMAQSSRLWVDLWFRNLNLATGAFWDDVRARNRAS